MKGAPFVHPKRNFGFEESPQEIASKIHSFYQKFYVGFGDIYAEKVFFPHPPSFACAQDGPPSPLKWRGPVWGL